jgi:hypothetical protein
MPPEIMPVCAVKDGTSKARSNGPSRRSRSAAVANAADQPRRVFDSVHAARRAQRTRGFAVHAASVRVVAFVRDDGAHAAFRELGEQQGCAETAQFLVERKCEMKLLAQRAPLDVG